MQTKTRISAIVASLLFAGAVVAADAQSFRRQSGEECWNPQQGHFERVRPGEYQGDLDFSRCRRVQDGERRVRDGKRQRQNVAWECWNPQQQHFEAVREGERQGDLDFSRCRQSAARSDQAPQECWNPQQGHFERVRPGEYQGDLDFSRCRSR